MAAHFIFIRYSNWGSSMQFSIITPSFRSSRWLKLCIASVADQTVEHEHIVQDSCSDDGTQDWLSKDSRVKAYIEKDQGMYDAINRGLRRASGDIIAHLNCDEQYLPGALGRVRDFFEKNPAIHVLFADAIVVNTAGDYLCHRPVYLPSRYHTWVANLATLTCATFFRRSVLDEYGMFFDPEFKIAGDSEWILRLFQKPVRMKVLRSFTSTFTETGENLALSPKLEQEKQKIFQTAPGWVRLCEPCILFQHRARRFATGLRYRKAFHYSIYTLQSPNIRVSQKALKPAIRWDRAQTPESKTA
jgi:glycosyltransferase involved in cell wall biosynthesis